MGIREFTKTWKFAGRDWELSYQPFFENAYREFGVNYSPSEQNDNPFGEFVVNVGAGSFSLLWARS